METSIIEQYDRLRYNIEKGFTIAFMFWYGFYIYSSNVQIENRTVRIIGIVLVLITWLIWTAYLLKLMRLGKILKNNEVVNNAINNELIEHYKLKSSFVGLVVTLISITVLLGISSFVQIQGKLVCEILLYVIVSSPLIAFLLYNKN
jgi:ABC-type spermidine/putrescine transport system permease subunit I